MALRKLRKLLRLVGAVVFTFRVHIFPTSVPLPAATTSSVILAMATLLPPPKRQKLYHGIPEPEQELPKPAPQIVVQFVSEDDGSSLAPAVSLPANVSREDLQVLVNQLTKTVRYIILFFPAYLHSSL